MEIAAEKGMLTREINRVEGIVKRMKETNKLGNLETTLRGLRGRLQELEKLEKKES